MMNDVEPTGWVTWQGRNGRWYFKCSNGRKGSCGSRSWANRKARQMLDA